METFKQLNRAAWIRTQEQVFGTNPAETQQWTQPKDIIRVLSPFCTRDSNHMFLPEGGGLDLDAVAPSHEKGCLELMTGGVVNIVRPARLLFESIQEYPSLSYFWLELQHLEPSDAYETTSAQHEEVVELTPGTYVDRVAWDLGYFGHDEDGLEIPLPREARLAVRWFTGCFVVFAKGSAYNSIPETYDAWQSERSAEDFRKLVTSLPSKWLNEEVV